MITLMKRVSLIGFEHLFVDVWIWLEQWSIVLLICVQVFSKRKKKILAKY